MLARYPVFPNSETGCPEAAKANLSYSGKL